MTTVKRTKRSIDILRAYCQWAKIAYSDIDDSNGFLIHIESGGKHLIASSKTPYPLNPSSSTSLTRDKTWTYLHLAQHGYLTPEGQHFFTVDKYRSFDTKSQSICAALDYAETLTYPVFVKPNSGASGKLARLVRSKDDLKEHFSDIAKFDHIALVQRPILSQEYRIFVLGDKVQFTYKKTRPILTGNGQQTIRQLMVRYNHNLKNKLTNSDPFFLNQLADSGFSLDDVLPKGESIRITPNSNLNIGGKMMDYNETINPALNEWAVKLVQLFGLKIAGIDVFGHQLDNPDQLVVLEINSMPTLSSLYQLGYKKKVFEIWSKILTDYFGEIPQSVVLK
ncbi:ATP-binding protein [Aureispira anguillae]|uniref:ATP-grasp domain-containing protein n=1 Tax=Aureispira anguillae TaxID=2864201 RepID=A0A915YBP4_9BACT|nr:ATP-grasp domain-containing protein [Aureispira anguillae]BDS10130.1 ATP-grasp domain-containing protein [Aureispira anguillae]